MIHFFATITLLIFSSATTASSTKEHPAPTYEEIMQMGQSIQKINALYLNCKMDSECILAGLKKMVEKDKDAVAKSMLEEIEKQQKNDMNIMDKCYQKEKSEVDNAGSLCATLSKDQKNSLSTCVETHLLELINKGNALAELTLLNVYQSQNDEKKITELKQKIDSNAREKGLNSLQRCLDLNNRK